MAERRKRWLSSTQEHLLLVLLLVLAATAVAHFKLLWRWDNLLYDTQLALWTRSASSDIIIVEIDDHSLAQLGRWPWPRDLHARLIDRVELDSPAAIGLDVIISEPDELNPQSDRALSDAIRRSERVVLPVFMAQQGTNGVPIEVLPLPQLARHAADLGHVHTALGNDGIARHIFLHEGIGKPRWPHFSLALLQVADPQRDIETSTPDTVSYSAMQWSRQSPLLIPFAGPPGHYARVSFAEVLAGNYPDNLFRDKIVLIGATAEGLGDALPTPLTHGGVMPGVEIIANMTDALINDLRIREVPHWLQLLLTALLVAIPALAYPYINPARTLAWLAGTMFASIALAALLLWTLGWWLPASALLLFQLLSYPLWSWRRLVLAMRHLNLELDLLVSLQRNTTLRRERNLTNQLEFLDTLLPLAGWVLYDNNGTRLLQHGKVAPKPARTLIGGSREWREDGSLWAGIVLDDRLNLLGIMPASCEPLTPVQETLLDNLLNDAQPKRDRPIRYLQDVIRTRIYQVQKLANEYEALQRIIDDSLAGMADGVLIADSHGQVMQSNQRACWYLRGDDDAQINGRSLTWVLQEVSLTGSDGWGEMFEHVIFSEQRALSEARHESGRDLLVQISPLKISGEPLPGLVLNFSDISRLKDMERKRSEVLNFLSHDLRSPLASMLAMLELAQERKNLDEVHGMLKRMESNTHKTLHLAEQFLHLSRATAHETIEFHEVDFVGLVLNACDQLWALSSRLQVTIEKDLQVEDLWTRAEPDLIERAIVNLLSNALKHSASGQKVTVSLSVEKGNIHCCISDHGSGIAADELPHLFEKYRRTRAAGAERIHGSGLGLAFVAAVAKRHDGEIDVHSELGKGSRFCLILPLGENN